MPQHGVGRCRSVVDSDKRIVCGRVLPDAVSAGLGEHQSSSGEERSLTAVEDLHVRNLVAGLGGSATRVGDICPRNNACRVFDHHLEDAS